MSSSSLAVGPTGDPQRRVGGLLIDTSRCVDKQLSGISCRGQKAAVNRRWTS